MLRLRLSKLGVKFNGAMLDDALTSSILRMLKRWGGAPLQDNCRGPPVYKVTLLRGVPPEEAIYADS